MWRREPWEEAVEREKREEQGMEGKRGRAEGVGGSSCVQWGDGAGKGREKRET